MKVEQLAAMNTGRRSSMDVAGALAMIKDCNIGKLILLARVNGDVKSEVMLCRLVYETLRRDLGIKAEGVAKVIVYELVYPITCKVCEGRKTITRLRFNLDQMPEVIEKPCYDCNQMGIHWRSSRERSKIANIARRTWRDHALCDVVTGWALALEREAGEAMKKFSMQ